MTETCFDAYVGAALWSSTDDVGDPLDARFDQSDIAPETLAKMESDCEAFLEAWGAVIARAAPDGFPNAVPAEAQAGHDLWLTRNGHGVGFWDGDWPEPYGAALSAAAEALGSFELYVGDDGALYV